MVKANVACGPQIFAGWVNLDKVDMSEYVKFLLSAPPNGLPPGPQATLALRVQAAGHVDFRVHDLRKGLPFDTDTVDYIYAGQVIEHLNPLYEVPQFLAECRRVLKPGGLARISTPDLDLLLASYQSGDMSEFAVEQPQPYRDVSKPLRLVYLMFGSIGPNSTTENYEGHMCCYNRISMKETLERAGFQNMAFFKPGESQSAIFREETIDTGISHSLFAEAQK